MKMSGGRRWPTIVVLLGLECVAPRAAAEPEAPSSTPSAAERARTERARELFGKGVALTEEDRWREALSAFELSSSLQPHASTTYNMGYCERGLGHFTRARKLFKQALAENRVGGEPELTPEQQSFAEQYLRDVEQKIARARVLVEPLGMTVRVDSRPLERDATEAGRIVMVAGTRDLGPAERAPAKVFTLFLDPGAHEFSLSTGKRQRRLRLSFAEGERREIRLVIAPAPGPQEDGRVRARATHHSWALGMAGLSVGAVAVGSVLGVMAIGNWNEAKDRCPRQSSCPNNDGFELSDKAKRQADYATLSFAVGGAALAGAAVFYFTAPDATEKDRGPKLQAAPLAGPNLLGVGVRATHW